MIIIKIPHIYLLNMNKERIKARFCSKTVLLQRGMGVHAEVPIRRCPEIFFATEFKRSFFLIAWLLHSIL